MDNRPKKQMTLEEISAREEEIQKEYLKEIESIRSDVTASTRSRSIAMNNAHLWRNEQLDEMGAERRKLGAPTPLKSRILEEILALQSNIVLGEKKLDEEAERLRRYRLWAHLVSEHKAGLSREEDLDSLLEMHDHEHTGPGTIRDHPRSSLSFSVESIVEVLSEMEETKPKFNVDLPNPKDPEAPWINYGTFDTREAAIAAVKHHFGADDEGRITIVSVVTP